MTYAKGTKVEIHKSKYDIEKLVKRHGAVSFAIMEHDGEVKVAFALSDRHIMFRVVLPETHQEQKERWRALLLVIKGKLESVATEIETVEEAFLANVVLPGGRTVYEEARDDIREAYLSGRDIPLMIGKV